MGVGMGWKLEILSERGGGLAVFEIWEEGGV